MTLPEYYKLKKKYLTKTYKKTHQLLDGFSFELLIIYRFTTRTV